MYGVYVSSLVVRVKLPEFKQQIGGWLGGARGAPGRARTLSEVTAWTSSRLQSMVLSSSSLENCSIPLNSLLMLLEQRNELSATSRLIAVRSKCEGDLRSNNRRYVSKGGQPKELPHSHVMHDFKKGDSIAQVTNGGARSHSRECFHLIRGNCEQRAASTIIHCVPIPKRLLQWMNPLRSRRGRQLTARKQ